MRSGKIFVIVVIIGIAVFIYLFRTGVFKREAEVIPNQMVKISSPAFGEGMDLPDKYTCKGENINPPLIIENVPKAAKSLVLVVEDPGAPAGVFTHWLVWNISPGVKQIAENSVPRNGIVGTNDFGNQKYNGPCPPSGSHRYFFRVYVLDAVLNLSGGVRRSVLNGEIKNHIIDRIEMVAIYPPLPIDNF